MNDYRPPNSIIWQISKVRVLEGVEKIAKEHIICIVAWLMGTDCNVFKAGWRGRGWLDRDKGKMGDICNSVKNNKLSVDFLGKNKVDKFLEMYIPRLNYEKMENLYNN